MNVNSIKINNVYHNGEVDLDVRLPEAVEGLDVIKGLDENKEVLGAKNLLPLTLENLKALNTAGTWNNNVYTFNGLSLTVNTDNLGSVESITMSGQPTSGYTFVLFQGTLNLPSTSKFKLGASGANANFYCSVLNGSTSIGYIDGANAHLNDVTLKDNAVTRVHIFFNTSYNASITIYPMIRLATDHNPTYRPYAMSNQELTQRLLSLEQRVAALEG